jgi:SAM-dependent methyltransferase
MTDFQHTAYDEIAYPSAIFRSCHPDRLAMTAHLHGLTPPPLETARVLEIGGGDGLNALAIGAAYPRAEVINFDLAGEPIARGRRWSATSGIANVRHEQLDILDAADRLDGTFDYIMAHGVYAWVPAEVSAALMALVGRRLSPNGVALISYNCLPGGHARRALREMVLHHVGHIADLRARIAAVREFLGGFAEPQDDDDAIVAVLRSDARGMLKRPDEVVLHDELGEIFLPYALKDVVGAAQAQGLSYLGDSGRELYDDFAGPEDADASEAAIVHRDQARDYACGRYFRSSLFVRRETEPSRRIDPARIRSLWASAFAQEVGESEFGIGEIRIAIGDAGLANVARRLIAAWPARIRVADLFDDEDHLIGLLRLSDAGIGDLHIGPEPFTLVPGEMPLASPLVRMQIAEGKTSVSTLDHRSAQMADERARQFVALLDGTRDRAALAEAWREIQGSLSGVPLDEALRLAGRTALLLR